MSHDEYTRALAEIQGGVSELTNLAITGRRLDEALPQLCAARERAETLAAELRKRADVLEAAVAT
jgi:hypothetical protein